MDKIQTMEIVKAHPAFAPRTKLESLAAKYKATVTFCPKYHCELTPIERLWCHQKSFIRKRTDQTYESLIRLYHESRENYVEKNINNKLIKRFWNCVEAYNSGLSYADILKTYFSGKSKAENKQHLVITNTNIDN